MWPKLEGQAAGEHEDASLGSVVRGQAHHGRMKRIDRSDIHDLAAPALLHHPGRRRLRGQDQPPEVHAVDAVEELGRHLEHRGHRIDPRVVHQDVDGTERLHAGGGHGLSRLVGGDIDGHGHGPGRAANLPRSGIGRLTVEVGHHHLGAGLDESGHDAAPDPHGPSGHDRALPRQIERTPSGHRNLLSSPVGPSRSSPNHRTARIRTLRGATNFHCISGVKPAGQPEAVPSPSSLVMATSRE